MGRARRHHSGCRSIFSLCWSNSVGILRGIDIAPPAFVALEAHNVGQALFFFESDFCAARLTGDSRVRRNVVAHDRTVDNLERQSRANAITQNPNS